MSEPIQLQDDARGGNTDFILSFPQIVMLQIKKCIDCFSVHFTPAISGTRLETANGITQEVPFQIPDKKREAIQAVNGLYMLLEWHLDAKHKEQAEAILLERAKFMKTYTPEKESKFYFDLLDYQKRLFSVLMSQAKKLDFFAVNAGGKSNG